MAYESGVDLLYNFATNPYFANKIITVKTYDNTVADLGFSDLNLEETENLMYQFITTADPEKWAIENGANTLPEKLMWWSNEEYDLETKRVLVEYRNEQFEVTTDGDWIAQGFYIYTLIKTVVRDTQNPAPVGGNPL